MASRDGVEFQTVVREKKPITLREAKVNLERIPSDKRKLPCCAVYNAQCPTNSSCCPARNLCCYSPNYACCGIVYYCCFFCACENAQNSPGHYACTDMKGIKYHLMKVDEEKGSLAWWSYSSFHVGPEDNTENSCYCY